MRAMALAMVRAAAAVLVVRTAVLIDARMRLLERRVSTVVMVRAAAAAMVRAVAAEAMVRAAAVIGDPPLERPQHCAPSLEAWRVAASTLRALLRSPKPDAPR